MSLRDLALSLCIMAAGPLPFAIVPQAVAKEGSGARPIVIGQSFVLDSSVLGEAREVNVYVPRSYSIGNAKHPVLYVLDGANDQDFHHISGLSQLGSINGQTQEFIVVGIGTIDRRRELTFPAADPRYRKEWPTHGNSGEFRKFIAKEVIPFIEAGWRTSNDRSLMGESLAGLFVIETLHREPELFGTYIAIDPSLWWDNGALALAAASSVPKKDGVAARFWFAATSETQVSKRMLDGLRKANPGLAISEDILRHETHASIYHPAATRAISSLYALPAAAEGACPWWFCENAALQP